MKRYLALTIICLMLALTVLGYGNYTINHTEEAVDQSVVLSRGDKAALGDLSLKTNLTYGNHLLWESLRNIGTGECRTDFSFNVSELPVEFPFSDTVPYQLYPRICNVNDENDPMIRMLQGLDTGSGISSIVNFIDYYDTYPLYFGYAYYYTDELYYLNAACNDQWASHEGPFTLLRIPVDKNDVAELYYSQNGNWVDINFADIKNLFQSFTVPCSEGVLVSVGFVPDAEPQAEWAPKGFGIWMLPLEASTVQIDDYTSFDNGFYSCDKARLVYPLDIETQHVLAFEQSKDEKSLFLITEENGEAILRVLDKETFKLENTWAIGSVQVNSNEISYYSNSNTEYPVTQLRYDVVQTHIESDFTAVAVGDRLTVLVPSADGWALDFSCDLVKLCRFYDENNNELYFWNDDENASPEDIENAITYSPVYGSYMCNFSEMPMIYKNRKLALAWYESDYSVHLQVYGPDGVIYAELSASSLLAHETIHGKHYFMLSNYVPEISWDTLLTEP